MDQVKSESGQSLVEYILLLMIVVSAYTAIMKLLGNTPVLTALKKPFTQDYKYTYDYGHADARGQSDGGPIYIPQCSAADQNFRIFINPPISQ